MTGRTLPHRRRIVGKRRRDPARRLVAGIAGGRRTHVSRGLGMARGAFSRHRCRIVLETRRIPRRRLMTGVAGRRRRNMIGRFPRGLSSVMALLTLIRGQIRRMDEIHEPPSRSGVTGQASPHPGRGGLIHHVIAGDFVAGTALPGEILILPAQVTRFAGDRPVLAGQGEGRFVVVECLRNGRLIFIPRPIDRERRPKPQNQDDQEHPVNHYNESVISHISYLLAPYLLRRRYSVQEKYPDKTHFSGEEVLALQTIQPPIPIKKNPQRQSLPTSSQKWLCRTFSTKTRQDVEPSDGFPSSQQKRSKPVGGMFMAIGAIGVSL